MPESKRADFKMSEIVFSSEKSDVTYVTRMRNTNGVDTVSVRRKGEGFKFDIGDKATPDTEDDVRELANLMLKIADEPKPGFLCTGTGPEEKG